VMKELKRFRTDPLTQLIPVMVLANKVDVPAAQRKVSFEEARQAIPVEIDLGDLSALYAGNTEMMLSKIIRSLCAR
jgi:tRNA threonylcarbamoyladenosine modification (KEOPS) complex  Pcc1 subunit